MLAYTLIYLHFLFHFVQHQARHYREQRAANSSQGMLQADPAN